MAGAGKVTIGGARIARQPHHAGAGAIGEGGVGQIVDHRIGDGVAGVILTAARRAQPPQFARLFRARQR